MFITVTLCAERMLPSNMQRLHRRRWRPAWSFIIPDHFLHSNFYFRCVVSLFSFFYIFTGFDMKNRCSNKGKACAVCAHCVNKDMGPSETNSE